MKFAEQTHCLRMTAFMDVIARLMDAVTNQVRNRWVCFYRNGFVFALLGFVRAGLPPRCGGYCGQVSGSDRVRLSALAQALLGFGEQHLVRLARICAIRTANGLCAIAASNFVSPSTLQAISPGNRWPALPSRL